MRFGRDYFFEIDDVVKYLSVDFSRILKMPKNNDFLKKEAKENKYTDYNEPHYTLTKRIRQIVTNNEIDKAFSDFALREMLKDDGWKILDLTSSSSSAVVVSRKKEAGASRKKEAGASELTLNTSTSSSSSNYLYISKATSNEINETNYRRYRRNIDYFVGEVALVDHLLMNGDKKRKQTKHDVLEINEDDDVSSLSSSSSSSSSPFPIAAIAADDTLPRKKSVVTTSQKKRKLEEDSKLLATWGPLDKLSLLESTVYYEVMEKDAKIRSFGRIYDSLKEMRYIRAGWLPNGEEYICSRLVIDKLFPYAAAENVKKLKLPSNSCLEDFTENMDFWKDTKEGRDELVKYLQEKGIMIFREASQPFLKKLSAELSFDVNNVPSPKRRGRPPSAEKKASSISLMFKINRNDNLLIKKRSPARPLYKSSDPSKYNDRLLADNIVSPVASLAGSSFVDDKPRRGRKKMIPEGDGDDLSMVLSMEEHIIQSQDDVEEVEEEVKVMKTEEASPGLFGDCLDEDQYFAPSFDPDFIPSQKPTSEQKKRRGAPKGGWMMRNSPGSLGNNSQQSSPSTSCSPSVIMSSQSSSHADAAAASPSLTQQLFSPLAKKDLKAEIAKLNKLKSIDDQVFHSKIFLNILKPYGWTWDYRTTGIGGTDYYLPGYFKKDIPSLTLNEHYFHSSEKLLEFLKREVGLKFDQEKFLLASADKPRTTRRGTVILPKRDFMESNSESDDSDNLSEQEESVVDFRPQATTKRSMKKRKMNAEDVGAVVTSFSSSPVTATAVSSAVVDQPVEIKRFKLQENSLLNKLSVSATNSSSSSSSSSPHLAILSPSPSPVPIVEAPKTLGETIDAALNILSPQSGDISSLFPLIGREEESKKVFSVILHYLRFGSGSYCYLSGTSGTGKSLTMNSAVNYSFSFCERYLQAILAPRGRSRRTTKTEMEAGEEKEEEEEENLPFISISLNGNSISSKRTLLTSILEEIGENEKCKPSTSDDSLLKSVLSYCNSSSFFPNLPVNSHEVELEQQQQEDEEGNDNEEDEDEMETSSSPVLSQESSTDSVDHSPTKKNPLKRSNSTSSYSSTASISSLPSASSSKKRKLFGKNENIVFKRKNLISGKKLVKPMIILLIDEIDACLPLREFLEKTLSSHLLLIATGNTMSASSSSSFRTSSSYSTATVARHSILYKPYEASDLKMILQSRVGNLFDDFAIQFLASKVIGSSKGDVRKLCDYAAAALQNAAYSTDADGKFSLFLVFTCLICLCLFREKKWNSS
jgi:Cdc6-like AAA superfamily ATPase